METNDENTKKCINNIDFWKDSQDFLESQLPTDYKQNLHKFVKDKGYNQNELRLFNSMLKDCVGLYGTLELSKML